MEKPINIPETPGVYIFKDDNGVVQYVGKAKNLKNRVESYFSNNLLTKTAQMVQSSTNIKFIKVISEFEALLLEANLIKKYKPKYNIALKDDKSPLYIGITKDEYPRIITFRKPEMDNLRLKSYYGPFLSGYIAKRILRLTRKIFPFSTHLPTNKICLYNQLGLCDPCPSEIENTTDPKLKAEMRKKYLRNVRNVRYLLNGKLGIVGRELEREIKKYANEENFEEARNIAEQLKSFQYIALSAGYDAEEYMENPNLAEDIFEEEARKLSNIIKRYFPDSANTISRIECFDIAHLSGSFPTASMVTFIDGVADKKYYRHFKIYQNKKNSDVDSMKEVIIRRLKHFDDWGRPDLIIIDGGKPQLTSVGDILDKTGIAYIGLAKRLETIVIRTDGGFVELRARNDVLRLLQRIRDEAHRFARRLHHHQMKKSLLS